MAQRPDKVEVEVNLSPQDRRRIDRITKAVEALVKQGKSTTWTNNPDAATTDIYRDAVSGNFVTKEYAMENPNTTVKESVRATQITPTVWLGEQR